MNQFRARLAGLAATLVLITLTVVAPVVLLRAGPHFLARAGLPGLWTPQVLWSMLLRPDDGSLFVLLLVAAAWVAWVVLTAVLLVEVVAVARGVQAPYLPGLPQSAARRLVSTALLLFVAVPSLPSPAAVAAGPTEPTPTTEHVEVSPRRPAQATDASAGVARVDPIDHVVQRGESLWSIATTHLGSGSRLTEIVELNSKLLGGRPGFLRPGWVLKLPAPATAGATASAPAGTYTVVRGDTLTGIAARQLGNARAFTSIVELSRDIVQPGGRRLTDPNVIDVGWTLRLPGQAAAAPVSEEPAPAPVAPSAAPRPAEPAPPAVPESVPTAVPESVPAASAAPVASDTPTDQVVADDSADAETPPAWLLASLTGTGVGLAASLWLALRRLRAAQFRARRPGRLIRGTPAELTGVEKTLMTVGRAAAPEVQFMDAALRRLAHARGTAGEPMPPLLAVQLAPGRLVLHVAAEPPVDLPEPWQAVAGTDAWQVASDVDPDSLGDLNPDLPAPYPQLVTWGSADDGSRWLVNLEQLGVTTVTGPADVVDDFARYLVAEVAVNAWSIDATVAYAGLGDSVEALNPRRVHRYGVDETDARAARVLADSLVALDRLGDARSDEVPLDVPTARALQAGTELWDARLFVTASDSNAPTTDAHPDAVAALVGLVAGHPGQTGTAVLALGGATRPGGWRVELGADRRLRSLPPLPDLAAVGLSEPDAKGCATLLGQADDPTDVPMPELPVVADAEPSHVDQAGLVRVELTRPRGSDAEADDACLLPAPDEEYLAVAATTGEDLASLAPVVPTATRQALADADPDLDEAVQDWFSDACPLPRLGLLGEVTVRVGPTGSPAAARGRLPQLFDLLAYLATRPHGASTAEVAHAISCPEPRVRKNVRILREWLGLNPLTGEPHVPDARQSRAAQSRGQAAYEVQDVLVDADLFRRLRTRAQARGAAGIADLELALSLVRGLPFDGLRAEGGIWLTEGDRLDHILSAAIVDVAHVVATACLHQGDTDRARNAAESALRAVPDDETSQLDLAAILAAEGDPAAARGHVRARVCDRSDDEVPIPTELPPRSDQIIRAHDWFGTERRTAV